MKKSLIMCLAFLSIFTFTGCGNKVELNLDEVQTELEKLTNDKFSFNAIQLSAENNEYFYDEDIYDTEEEFGLTYEYFDQIIARKNSETEEKYVVIKPVKQAGSEEKIIDIMEKYTKKQKLETKYEKYQDYLIYVIGNKPEEMMKRIKDSKSPIFQSLIEIKKPDLENLMGVKESWVEESLVMNSAIIVNSNLYFIIKPKKENSEDVQKAVDKYMVDLEEQWKTYLPDQYELVKNRKFEKLGDYLVYIVSEDNDLVYNKIKDLAKK
ncbi:MAG: DUF4358 domain-containing protein [Bacilli bacterium]|nr:DUF4358 domain-containing protein [Bacilli bacterium]